MNFKVFLIVTICVVGVRSACPKWDSVNVTYHTDDQHFYKIKGDYYAYAIIPRPEHEHKKCIYFNMYQINRNLLRLAFRSTDKRDDKEELLRGRFDVDHASSKLKLSFDNRKIQPWDDLVLTDIGKDYGIFYHCIGDKMHPYTFMRRRRPPVKVINDLVDIMASRGIPKEQLTFIDQRNCKN